ncbi:MAG: hypothetical protein ACRDZQ_04220 [Acidimicrobiales bacterium]
MKLPLWLVRVVDPPTAYMERTTPARPRGLRSGQSRPPPAWAPLTSDGGRVASVEDLSPQERERLAALATTHGSGSRGGPGTSPQSWLCQASVDTLGRCGPGLNHLAFHAGSPDEVDRLVAEEASR